MSEQSLLFDDCDPTLCARDGPAKETAWLDGVLEWLTIEAASGGRSVNALPPAVPVGFLERTCLAFCPSTAEGIGLPCSGRWGTWGMGSPTAFSTLSGSECPKDAAVCSLSDVLETGELPQKYFLSPKACRGILRRAEKRGRELPPALRAALQTVAESTNRGEDERTT